MLGRLRPDDPVWFGDACRMTVASLSGFIVAAMFVSLEALEIPYYAALLGAGTLMVYGQYVKQEAVLEDAVDLQAHSFDDIENAYETVLNDHLAVAAPVATRGDWRDEIDMTTPNHVSEHSPMIMN